MVNGRIDDVWFDRSHLKKTPCMVIRCKTREGDTHDCVLWLTHKNMPKVVDTLRGLGFSGSKMNHVRDYLLNLVVDYEVNDKGEIAYFRGDTDKSTQCPVDVDGWLMGSSKMPKPPVGSDDDDGGIDFLASWLGLTFLYPCTAFAS